MDMEAIRRGLAANLRTVPDCQVSAYLLDNPTGPALEVAGFDNLDYLADFRRGATLHLLIEGVVPGVDSRAAYTAFDRWLIPGSDSSVVDALLADRQLTKRLTDKGTVLTGQPAACSDLTVTQFRGYRFVRTRDGQTDVLVGNWAIDLLT